MTEEPLGNHAQFIRGVTFKPTDKCEVGRRDSLVCLRTTNVQQTLDESDLIAIPASIVKNPEKLVRLGDILVSSANSWNLVGRCCRVESLRHPSTAGGFISILRADPSHLDPSYLYRWFASDRTQATVRSLGNQTTNISNLDHKRTLSLLIPLPPLPEQKRIAAILDAADALREKRRESIEQLDSLIQATFLEMFGECDRPPTSIGPPSFGSKAGFVPLSKVATLATGHTPDRAREDYWGGSIPWISLTDIRTLDGNVAFDTIQNVTESGLANSSSVLLPKGTVCLSRTASIGFVTVMGREMATSQDFVNWVCGPTINPIYLMTALRQSRPYLLSKSAGSTHKTIYYRHAEEMEILLPPLEQQARFASIVESIEAQKTRLKAHLAELDALFSSLQSRAFNGELVA